MTAPERHEIRITAARDGVPTEAECSTCGRRWARPEDDPNADTLPTWGRIHMETP